MQNVLTTLSLKKARVLDRHIASTSKCPPARSHHQRNRQSLTALASLIVGCAALLTTPLDAQRLSISILNNISYSSINSSVRILRVYWPPKMPVTAKTRAVIWIHGGGFYKGDLNVAGVTPANCATTDTYACWLAANGIPVYDINYTLVKMKATGKDLAVDHNNETTVRSVSHPFAQSDVGSGLIVLQGAGWASGGYKITAVNADGSAILDQAPTRAANPRPARYELIQGGTMWPAQWQDVTCALSWAAENLGINYPGDSKDLVLMGHSAGGHLALTAGLIPPGTFPSSCDHTNPNYAVHSIIALSPPSNLRLLYEQSVGGAQPDIRHLLGCIPGTRDCDAIADAASPVSYLSPGQPQVVAFSGQLDLGVPPINVQEIQLGYQSLGVSSLWIVEPGQYHSLYAFYYNPCSATPGAPEPTPCGSAGNVFRSALPYICRSSSTHPAFDGPHVNSGTCGPRPGI